MGRWDRAKMDNQIKDFLVGIIGVQGQKVVERLCKNSPELESVIIPRALMSWVSVLSNLEKFDGPVPGIQNSQLKFEKIKKNYNGEIKINETLVKFENDGILKVAATLAVNLNMDVEGISKEVDRNKLAILGKTLDLITKSKFITDYKSSVKEAEISKSVKTEVANPGKVAKIKFTKKEPLAKSFKVSFEEMAKFCEVCGNKQFNKSDFVGCKCLQAMAKSTYTTKTNNGCVVKFKGKEWDEEALSAFLKIVRG